MLGKRKERTTNSPTPNPKNEGDIAVPQSGYTVARQLVLEELDLEIRVRQRLKETIESRIGWATCLETVVRENQGSESTGDTTGANVFQLAAADALHVAETPLLPILSRESRFPSRFTPEDIPTPPATSSNPYARPYTRLARLRRSPSSIRPAPQHLYIRDSSTNTIARLACPDCARGDFPRVQSLLNHCRIQHAREFGSHDDCIRGCAIQVPVDEEAWVIENGSELRNVSLPSLRRLFEMAVGDVGNPSPVNDASSVPQDVNPEGITVSGREILSAPTRTSTHLSRTLGHHVDTPALAPFLGRAPKRRSIRTYDENAPVNIDGRPQIIPGRRRWRMPLTHRSRARPALDLMIPVDTPLPQITPHVVPVTHGTRFHVVARVTISDRSLWIPIDRRSVTAADQTHRWCLSIEAPTYGLPLSAVLEHATITCLSPSPPPTRVLDKPLELLGQPFFACGTTSQPFLARLRFEWTSGSLNPPLEVEHWVELDMLHTNTPVLGDEQVLDVELDRNTVFRQVSPSKQGLDPWNLDSESRPPPPKPAPALPSPGYITLLRSLVPMFPLTLRDLKGRSSPPLPYKLASTPAQLQTFVPGRRKAIEWARARALREAYEKAREEYAPGDEYPQLSIGEVFTWLRDAGLSLRRAVPPSASATAPTEKRIYERITPPTADEFCPACGIASTRHPPREAPSSSPSCPFSTMTRLPLLDVGSWVSTQTHYHPDNPTCYTPAQREPFHWSPRDVLAVTDPTLNIAVRSILFSLKLSCFQKSEHEASISGGGGHHPNGTDDRRKRGPVDFPSNFDEFTSLMASAILALSVRGFARSVVQSAVTALASDSARIRGNQRAVIAPAHLACGVAGSPLVHNGVLAGLPVAQGRVPPVALALSTLAQLPRKGLPQSSAVMDTSC